MRILIVHQYFKTPKEGGGIRTYHISHAFSKAGHDIHVLSGHNRLEGKQSIEGINVNYFKIPYSNKLKFIKRVIAFLKFVNKCKSFIKNNNSFDLAYIVSTPLTTAYIALHLKKKFNIPYAFEIGDLWPEVPIQLGIIKNSLVKNYFYNLEFKVYSEAKFLIGLSPQIKEAIESTIDHKKVVHMAPNMADVDFFKPSILDEVTFSENVPFRICYTGSLGYTNNVPALADLAQAFHESQLSVNVELIGDGSERSTLINNIQELTNIMVFDHTSMDRIRQKLDNCQAVVISYRKEQILNTGSPNKFFDGLAAGKLIIINFKGWIKELIEKNECGFYYDPDKPETLPQLLEPFMADPILLKQYQNNARKLAEIFSVNKVTGDLIRFIEM